ncbi:carboxypeptidase regulatory-like domain-containing protein [Pendulispora albinea]|uniref:Carboxypeptidase regulatory-like domain-containing protein n=1 Tax=Pendulispora albinea TaxID=2741071 RepID=A0ABZ2LXY7_9BACT
MKSRKFAWGIWLGLIGILATFAVLRLRRGDTDQRAGEQDAPAATGNETPSASEAIDDSVLPRATLAGRVTDPAKRPIAGASVCAFAASERLATAETRQPRCVVADPEGRYRVSDLFAAKYRVSASAPQHQPAFWYDAAAGKGDLELKPGEARENVDIVLDAGGVQVRGRVKDISGGTIHAAIVTVSSSGGGNAVAESNAEGEWQVWVAPGNLQAAAMANGYADGTKEGIAPGQFIEIVLTPESVLQGKVVEAGTETPVAGARVSAGAGAGEGFFPMAAMPFGGPGMQDGATAVTDAEGRFRIARLSPGRYKPQATGAHRWGTARESVLLGVGETSSELVIEAHPALSVSGKVALSEKQACSEGVVSLADKTSLERRVGAIERDGQVRMEGVLPGKYEVDVRCSEGASEDKYEPVAVADKDVSGLVWKVAAGGAVRGVVVDSGGQPVASAHVLARPKGGDPRARTNWGSAATDKDGTFRMRGLTAGTYALEVRHPAYPSPKEPIEVKVDRDVDGLRITLPAGGIIEGTVMDNGGAPVAGMNVRAQGKSFEWNRTTTRDDGTFVLKGLSAGEYRVWAEQGFGERVRAPGTRDEDAQGTPATVRPGETARVKLVVESRKGRIRGRVVGEANEPLSDVFVDAERESEDPSSAEGSARRKMQWGRRATTVLAELDGSFTIDKLAPGTYTVRAYRKGGGESVLEKVRVGSEVTLTIRTAASIAGTVVGAGGKSPERFTVSARDIKTGFARQESFFRTHGAFALRELAAGKYQVSAEASEGRALAEITLAQSEKRQGVRLEFESNARVRGQVISLESGEPLAGMYVSASPTKGGPSGMAMMGDSDRKNITDTNGRFEIENCPAGRVFIFASPKDYRSSEYAFASVPATIEAGRTNEIPPVRVPRRRTKGFEVGGDLGFSIQQSAPGSDMEQARVTVSVVRPNGPAAKAGLVAGDEIVSVDGYSVAPPNMGLYHALSRVAEGTRVTFGLARGGSVVVQAEKPL